MAANNLIKKLKKEILRNKAKSAVLCGMCLVAVYFWGPLLFGWIAPDAASGEKKVSVNELAEKTMATTATTSNPAPPPDRREQRHRWTDISRWLDEDPAMTTAKLGDDFADPFRTFDVPDNTLEDGDEKPEPQAIEIAQDITPAELGMVLGSTLVGRTNRAARINGQRYLENSVVTVSVAGTKKFDEAMQNSNVKNQVAFLLKEVQVQYVVLTRNGIDYALPLSRAELGGQQRQVFQRPPMFERPRVVNN